MHSKTHHMLSKEKWLVVLNFSVLESYILRLCSFLVWKSGNFLRENDFVAETFYRSGVKDHFFTINHFLVLSVRDVWMYATCFYQWSILLLLLIIITIYQRYYSTWFIFRGLFYRINQNGKVKNYPIVDRPQLFYSIKIKY